MTLKYTDSDLSAALAKGREEALEEAARKLETIVDKILHVYSRGPTSPPGNIYVAFTGKHAAEIVRALSPSSPGEPAGSGWQPIATAPKDGRWIIALFKNERDARRVKWGKDGWGNPSWIGQSGAYVEEQFWGWIGFPSGTSSDDDLPAPPHEPIGET